MLKYLTEMSEVIKKYNLTLDDIMIVGSSAITAIGGRENNDIEFCVSKPAWNKIPSNMRKKLFFLDHEDLSENVDLFRNRYICIGFTDYDLFDKGLYTHWDGFKIVNPEVEYLYKAFKRRDKDIIDMKNIEETESLKQSFDWDYIRDVQLKGTSAKNIRYDVFRQYSWRYVKKMERILHKIGGGMS